MGSFRGLLDAIDNKIRRNVSLSDQQRQHAYQLIDELQRMMAESPAPGRILTWEDAMRYFHGAAPRHTRFSRAVLLRQRVGPNAFRVIQVFLDAADNVIPMDGRRNVPYGRQFIVNGFDDELNRALDGTDVLIVQ